MKLKHYLMLLYWCFTDYTKAQYWYLVVKHNIKSRRKAYYNAKYYHQDNLLETIDQLKNKK